MNELEEARHALIDEVCNERDALLKSNKALQQLVFTLTRERNKFVVERDSLRHAIERYLIAWNTGELQCDVPNGRYWDALKVFKELAEEKK